MNTKIAENLASRERERIRVVSLLPDVCNAEKVLRTISDLAEAKIGGYVCVSTVHMVMEAYDDAEFAKMVNAADVIITDGMPLVWMQRMQGAKTANRLRGNDLMIMLCEVAEKRGLKVGFYGGAQNTIDLLLKRAKADLPNLEIAYSFSPPFRDLSDEENSKIIEEIKNSGAQILFVGLGCPKQEKWMAANKTKISAVMLGVGAAFDFYAGNLKESPEWIGNLGFEWLYRFFQEPKRLWRRYLILNPRFVWIAGLQLLGLKKFEN